MISAAAIGNQQATSATMVQQPGNWSVIHVPAVNTQATVTKAAVAGVRHICTGIYASLIANTTAPAAIVVTLSLIDGASGGTSYLWRQSFALQAIAGLMDDVNISGLSLPGSLNTAMTLEFSAAGGANTFETITLTGVDVS